MSAIIEAQKEFASLLLKRVGRMVTQSHKAGKRRRPLANAGAASRTLLRRAAELGHVAELGRSSPQGLAPTADAPKRAAVVPVG
jgi:hypothetical protein